MAVLITIAAGIADNSVVSNVKRSATSSYLENDYSARVIHGNLYLELAFPSSVSFWMLPLYAVLYFLTLKHNVIDD